MTTPRDHGRTRAEDVPNQPHCVRLASTPIAAALPPTSPDGADGREADAELVGLGEQLKAAAAAEASAWARCMETQADEDTRIFESVAEKSSAIVHRIEQLPADTLKGVLVKVRALKWCMDDDPVTAGDLGNAAPTYALATNVRVAVSLLGDLYRMQAD
jgi:hypothetical protein